MSSFLNSWRSGVGRKTKVEGRGCARAAVAGYLDRFLADWTETLCEGTGSDYELLAATDNINLMSIVDRMPRGGLHEMDLRLGSSSDWFVMALEGPTHRQPQVNVKAVHGSEVSGWNVNVSVSGSRDGPCHSRFNVTGRLGVAEATRHLARVVTAGLPLPGTDAASEVEALQTESAHAVERRNVGAERRCCQS